MSNRNIKVIFLSVPFLAFSSVSMAQQTQTSAAGVQLGPGVATPSIEVRALHDDNLLDQPSGSELETWGWGVSPSVNYEMSDNISRITANWLLDAGFYDQSSADNYVDNFLNATYEYHPTDRFDASIRGSFKDTRDPRGTGRSESTGIIQATPDQWHDFEVEGNAGYGLTDTRARVEGTVGYVTKRYDNNLSSTFSRNRDDTYGSGRFFYRLAPKTSLLVEGRATSFQYTLTAFGTPTLDSTVYKVFGGLKWEATAKTTGSVRVGYMKKNFDAAARTDASDVAWEVNIAWQPRTYSTVTFDTARNFNETNGTGDFIQEDTYGVNWNHGWSNRVSTNAYFNYANDNYKPSTRKDDLINLGVNLNYALKRWFTLVGDYHYESRDSNNNLFDYDRNIFTVSLRLTL